MNIGLMGGTFNPIHLAHLRIAEEARDLCRLDRIIFIPAGDPPHKPLAGEVSFEHRSAMVSRAIGGNACFKFSGIEGERAGKSYAIDTISYFREKSPNDELFFIIGSDSFLEIGLWHCFAEIFRACSLIVVSRPGITINDPLLSLPVAIRREFRFDAVTGRLEHDSGTSVNFISGCQLDISSSYIRDLMTAGRSIRYLVPPQVEAYITEQGIYNRCR